MSDSPADGVIRGRLPDDTLLVFLSDTHIGGPAGSDIFESSAELTLLLEDLDRHHGPVELVLAGDFLDLLRMEDADGNGDRVAATITRPEYQRLFAAPRRRGLVEPAHPAVTERGRACRRVRAVVLGQLRVAARAARLL
jgi:hypothetical protein